MSQNRTYFASRVNVARSPRRTEEKSTWVNESLGVYRAPSAAASFNVKVRREFLNFLVSQIVTDPSP